VANILVEQPPEETLSEDQLVLIWRREQFAHLGFGSVDARLLADSPADLGEARRLRRAGCPLDLAFRILA
jgi:hypothetical protein